MAIPVSPCRRLRHRARSIATSEDEQAVSMAMLRPLQAVEVRQPAIRRVQRGALQKVRSQSFFRYAILIVLCVLGHADADEDAGVLACETLGIDASVFQRFPTGLQKKSLLRIGAERLARRDAEELRIEVARIGEQPGPFAVGLARRVLLRIEKIVQIDALVGNLRDRVALFEQKLPRTPRDR